MPANSPNSSGCPQVDVRAMAASTSFDAASSIDGGDAADAAPAITRSNTMPFVAMPFASMTPPCAEMTCVDWAFHGRAHSQNVKMARRYGSGDLLPLVVA